MPLSTLGESAASYYGASQIDEGGPVKNCNKTVALCRWNYSSALSLHFHMKTKSLKYHVALHITDCSVSVFVSVYAYSCVDWQYSCVFFNILSHHLHSQEWHQRSPTHIAHWPFKSKATLEKQTQFSDLFMEWRMKSDQNCLWKPTRNHSLSSFWNQSFPWEHRFVRE